MKTPGWFKRGAATTAIFLFGGSLVSGVLLSLMMIGVYALGPPADGDGFPPWLAGLLGGVLLEAGPALLTGLGMSFASLRIRSTAGWIGWSALINTIPAAALIALIASGRAPEREWLFVAFVTVVVLLPCILGGVAAAALSLKIRPRPTTANTASTADVFA